MSKYCECGLPILFGRSKYCSKKCYNKYHKTNSYEKQKEKASDVKSYIVDKLGGKCSSCGYYKNIKALSIIHKSEEKVKFNFTITNMSNKSKLSINRESAKCYLLCLNCEAEKNNPNPLP